MTEPVATPSRPADSDPLLDVIVTAYLKAVEGGEAPDRAVWLARHPALAADLAEFFADLDDVDRLARPLRAVIAAAESAAGPGIGVPARSFGDYDLLAEIGRGGMGVVYKARQRSLNRMVALKMVGTGAWGRTDDAARFRHEAEAVARLDHPNVVPVYEVGEHGGCVYFTMKLVDGPSLADRLADPIDPPAAARLVGQVAR